MVKRLVGTMAVGVFIVVAGCGGDALAAPPPIAACVAQDIVDGDPGCPASGLCTITQVFTIADGCILDFGTRDVTIAVSGELRIPEDGRVALKAANFTVAAGGSVDGCADTFGASFTVQATGNIAIQRSRGGIGRIRVSGGWFGGAIDLDAGGNITIEGQLQSNNLAVREAGGGSITLRAGGNVVTTPESDVDLHGGLDGWGGVLDVAANGLIEISNEIDVTGGDGGIININAGGKVIIRDKLDVTGNGNDSGWGGEVHIVAGTDVEIDGQIQSRGGGSVSAGGGDGGWVTISAGFGNITVGDEISVKGGAPDGCGGNIDLFAGASIEVRSTSQLIASGDTYYYYCSQGLRLRAWRDVTVDGRLDASGASDADGGVVEIDAGRNIALNALVDARATTPGYMSGWVTIQAGGVTTRSGMKIPATGNLTITSTIDVSAPGCDAWGCSYGGYVDAGACDITLGSGGLIKASAPGVEGEGGIILLTARDQMTILGSLDATGGAGWDGSITLTHPVDVPPIVTGSVLPAPTFRPLPWCTGDAGDPPGCLSPCPTCGNGVTEFPETCDDTTGTPESCDGCSMLCYTESCDDAACPDYLPVGSPCDDGNECTEGDSCDGEGVCMPGRWVCDTTTTTTLTTTTSTITTTTTTTTLTTTTMSTTTTTTSTTTTTNQPPTTTTTTTSVPTTTTVPSTTSTSTTTSTTLPCAAAPVRDCIGPEKGMLRVNEKWSGKEKVQVVLGKLTSAVSQDQFGDPVMGTTRYHICIYDQADVLVRQMEIDRAGQSCGTPPRLCWKALSDQGYKYNDKDISADGIQKIIAKGGGVGRGKVIVSGRNNASKGQTSLPTGIATALLNNTKATVQVVTSDADCFEVTATDVKKADGLMFKALGGSPSGASLDVTM